MPWHRGLVHLVTPGYWPQWLNLSHPRLRATGQAALLPPSAALPCLNQNALEYRLDRLPGLTSAFMQVAASFEGRERALAKGLLIGTLSAEAVSTLVSRPLFSRSSAGACTTGIAG